MRLRDDPKVSFSCIMEKILQLTMYKNWCFCPGKLFSSIKSQAFEYTTMSVVGVEHVLGNWSVQFVGSQLSLASGNLEQKL